MSYFEDRMAEIKESNEIAGRNREIINALREVRREAAREAKQQNIPNKIVLDDDNPAEFEQPPSGHVYFWKSGSLVKIGFSTNMLNRITNLRVANPTGATLMAAIPGYIDTEKYFHKMFEKYRDHGEWFRIEGDLALFMKKMPSHIPQKPLKRIYYGYL